MFQVKYYTEAHKLYSDLSNRIEGFGGTKENGEDLDSGYDQRVQQKLAEIRALSITVDD